MEKRGHSTNGLLNQPEQSKERERERAADVARENDQRIKFAKVGIKIQYKGKKEANGGKLRNEEIFVREKEGEKEEEKEKEEEVSNVFFFC